MNVQQQAGGAAPQVPGGDNRPAWIPASPVAQPGAVPPPAANPNGPPGLEAHVNAMGQLTLLLARQQAELQVVFATQQQFQQLLQQRLGPNCPFRL